MLLAVQCIVCCIIFTLIILPAQYRNPLVMLASYPPAVIRRVKELPQYNGCADKSEKKHIAKKIIGAVFLSAVFAAVAFFSGKRDIISAFINVFIIISSINIYDLLVLDWGVFCHSRKLRIKGTEDMDEAYKDRLFHLRGALIGEIIAVVVAVISSGMVCLMKIILK